MLWGEFKCIHCAILYCIFFSKELNSTLIGSCPYGSDGWLPRNVSELEDDIALRSYLYRKGQLCGECEDSYYISQSIPTT